MHDPPLNCITTRYSGKLDVGSKKDKTWLFKEQMKIHNKLPQLMQASIFSGSQIWDTRRCHINLDAIVEILKHTLNYKSTLVNIWGGNNIFGIALVNLCSLLMLEMTILYRILYAAEWNLCPPKSFMVYIVFLISRCPICTG